MIQLYALKKNFDTQKAQRFFAERRVKIQAIDLTRAPMGRRELEAVCHAVGLRALIDEDSTAWKTCPARFAAGDAAVFEALLQNPGILRLPIVRNGRQATVGFTPEIWTQWLQKGIL